MVTARSEKGAELVAAVTDHAAIGAVNLAEVTSKLARDDIAIGVVREWLDALELDVRPFDRELAYGAGALVPDTRAQGLALGGRACLALAHALGATTLTTARGWRGVDGGGAIEVIR